MLQENRAKRSPAQIVGLIVICILAVLIILTFVIFGMFKGTNSAPKIFGKRVYVVSNDRMEPRLKKGTAVFIEEGRMPDPDKQSVLLCRIDDQLWVIGFVGTETTETGEVRYLVKYDNATDDKTWGIKESDIIGVAVTEDYFTGRLISFASSKAGILTIVIIPCLLVIIYEVVMLLASMRGVEHEGKPTAAHKKKEHRSHDEKEPVIRRVGGGPDEDDFLSEREDIKAPVDTVREERFVEKQLRKANDKLSTTVMETTGVIESDEIKLDSLSVEPEPKRPEPAGNSGFGAIIFDAETVADSVAAEEGIRTAEEPKPEPKAEPKAAEPRFDFEAAAVPGFDSFIEEMKKDAAAESEKLAAEAASIRETVITEPEEKAEELISAVEDIVPEPEPVRPAEPAPASDPLNDLSADRIDELIKLLEEEKKRLGE